MPQSRPEKATACPICGKPRKREFRPFCSSRCAQIDLGRWLKGTYVIPGEPAKEIPSAEDGDDGDLES